MYSIFRVIFFCASDNFFMFLNCLRFSSLSFILVLVLVLDAFDLNDVEYICTDFLR